VAVNILYKLGRMAGRQVRKARWMWESVAGSEAAAIQAEHAVGRDMAAVVLEQTPRDSDRTTQVLLDEIGEKLATVVRNRLHRFQMTAINTDRPTAFALPGGFIFVARALVHLCDRNNDAIAFVLDQAIGLAMADPQRYASLGRGSSEHFLPHLMAMCPSAWSDQRRREVAQMTFATLRGFLVEWRTTGDGVGIEAGLDALVRALDREEQSTE